MTYIISTDRGAASAPGGGEAPMRSFALRRLALAARTPPYPVGSGPTPPSWAPPGSRPSSRCCPSLVSHPRPGGSFGIPGPTTACIMGLNLQPRAQSSSAQTCHAPSQHVESRPVPQCRSCWPSLRLPCSPKMDRGVSWPSGAESCRSRPTCYSFLDVGPRRRGPTTTSAIPGHSF